MNVQTLQEMRDNGESLRDIANKTGKSVKYITANTVKPIIDHKQVLIAEVRKSRLELDLPVNIVCKRHGVNADFVYRHAPKVSYDGVSSLDDEDFKLMQELVTAGYSEKVVSDKFDVCAYVVKTRTVRPENIMTVTAFKNLESFKDLPDSLILTHKGYPIGTFTPS